MSGCTNESLGRYPFNGDPDYFKEKQMGPETSLHDGRVPVVGSVVSLNGSGKFLTVVGVNNMAAEITVCWFNANLEIVMAKIPMKAVSIADTKVHSELEP